MNTILVPLDGSSLAEQVLAYVRLLAPLVAARVQLLRVGSDEDLARVLVHEKELAHELGEQSSPGHASGEQLRQLLRQRAEVDLAERAKELRTAGIEVDVQLRDGFAAEQIIALAEHDHVTLIAMATHGYSGLRRWALGSVADKIIHASMVPLLVVRARE